MNVADAVVSSLEAQGVEYIFGIPGGALEPLSTALHKSTIKVILTKHEQGAAFMADGYARVSGKIGVCCSTAGPGATNLTTGIATSYADSIPVLALTAQAPTSSLGKGAVQEFKDESLALVGMFSKITKYSDVIVHEGKVHEIMAKALRTSLSGRTGPVHINLPSDIMRRDVPEKRIPCRIERAKVFDRNGVKEAATLLLKAKQPVILAGWGAVLSKADEEIRVLAEMLHIPICTSPKAKGIISEQHKLSMGVFGFAGSSAAKEYICSDSIDVMLAIGTSFNEWMTAGWDERIAPSEALIQIDIDYNEIGKNYPVAVGIMGDAASVLTELIFEIKRQSRDCGKRSVLSLGDLAIKEEELQEQKNEQLCEANSMYKPQALIRDLMHTLPLDTQYFVDIGSVMAWAIQYLDIKKPYSFYLPLGFTTMGFGTAAPVGAKLAKPNRPIVAIVGDGGFLMNGVEVATAVNYNVPVIWVVMNNSMLGMLYHGRKIAADPEGIPSRFREVDFVKIAEGLGAQGIKITRPGEINKKMMQKIIASGKPTVLDVIIDPEEVPPIHTRVKTLQNCHADTTSFTMQV